MWSVNKKRGGRRRKRQEERRGLTAAISETSTDNTEARQQNLHEAMRWCGYIDVHCRTVDRDLDSGCSYGSFILGSSCCWRLPLGWRLIDLLAHG